MPNELAIGDRVVIKDRYVAGLHPICAGMTGTVVSMFKWSIPGSTHDPAVYIEVDGVTGTFDMFEYNLRRIAPSCPMN